MAAQIRVVTVVDVVSVIIRPRGHCQRRSLQIELHLRRTCRKCDRERPSFPRQATGNEIICPRKRVRDAELTVCVRYEFQRHFGYGHRHSGLESSIGNHSSRNTRGSGHGQCDILCFLLARRGLDVDGQILITVLLEPHHMLSGRDRQQIETARIAELRNDAVRCNSRTGQRISVSILYDAAHARARRQPQTACRKCP